MVCHHPSINYRNGNQRSYKKNDHGLQGALICELETAKAFFGNYKQPWPRNAESMCSIRISVAVAETSARAIDVWGNPLGP